MTADVSIAGCRPGSIGPDLQYQTQQRDRELRMALRPGTPPVVEIGGDIDVQSAPELREELLRLIRRRGPRLALDLGGVTFMDCAGIGVLVATRRRARLEGGWIRIIRVSSAARRTISLLGLQEAFALAADGADRLALVTEPGHRDRTVRVPDSVSQAGLT